MNVDLLGLFVYGSTLDVHANLNCVHITYIGRIKKQFLSRTKNTIRYNASPLCLHILSLPLLVYDLSQMSTY